MKKVLLCAVALMLNLIAASDVFAERLVLEERLCRAFEYEEDGVDAMIQFRMIDGELFVEQSGLAYWAAAISLDRPAVLSLESAAEVRIGATARRWSGFSMAGEFWDDGIRTEIALAADDTLSLRFGDEDPITARPSASNATTHDLAKYAEHLSGHLGADENILGRWENDGGSLSASFGASGRATIIMRDLGEPPKVFFCIFGSSGPSNIELIAERLGWGGQPFEMTCELLPDGSLALHEDIFSNLNDGIVLRKKHTSLRSSRL